MDKLEGNAIVGQSGGPTSVINATLLGVIETCMRSGLVGNIYGMRYGIEGFMQEQIIDLGRQSKKTLKLLKQTPSSALGSSRYKLQDYQLPQIKKILQRHNIRYFFLIGGNDTMDTINRIEQYCGEVGYELKGIGIPKTVDNDLYGTDHTPGYASAARSNILNVIQAGILARDMQRVDKFVVYQTVGRDAGWLAAATTAFKMKEADPPHLIYTPERDFDREKFLEDAQSCVKAFGWVSIVCGEGIKFADGRPVSAAQSKDKFDNVEFGAMGGSSAAVKLHQMLHSEFGYRGEFQITESLIMCAMDRALNRDINEAYLCGAKAVELAESGETGYMIGIVRNPGEEYDISYEKVPLKEVAIRAKPMPHHFLNEQGNMTTEEFRKYIKPLIGEPPQFTQLKWIKV